MKFKISKKSSYDPKFVEKVDESRQQAKEGKTKRVKKEDLNGFLGL